MDFQFQPWERFAPEITDGAAGACVQIVRRRWVYRECGPFHWARPLDKPALQWNYLLRPLAVAVSSLGTLWEQPGASNLAEFLDSWSEHPLLGASGNWKKTVLSSGVRATVGVFTVREPI